MITKGISAGDIETIHKEYTPQISGMSLFPNEIRLTGDQDVYKSRFNFDNIDYIFVEMSVRSNSGAYQKKCYFKIGGTIKATATASGTAWANHASRVDCTGISGDQDVVFQVEDQTTNDAEIKQIMFSIVRS